MSEIQPGSHPSEEEWRADIAEKFANDDPRIDPNEEVAKELLKRVGVLIDQDKTDKPEAQE